MIETTPYPEGYALSKYILLANAPDDISELYLNIKALGPVIASDMSHVSSQLGTSFEGLYYSVESIDSFQTKIMRGIVNSENTKSAYELASGFKNFIRFTEICEHDKIFSVAKSTIGILQKEGYTLSEIRNYYIAPFEATGYVGLHLNFISPYGQEMELKVHSRESLEANKQGFVLYEQVRDIGSVLRDKAAIKEKVFEIHGRISKPKGFEDLVDFKLPAEEKERLLSEGRAKTDVLVQHSDFKEPPFVVICTVKHGGRELYYGYEHCYKDGSLNVYRLDKQGSTTTSIDKHGNVIVSHETPPMRKTIGECLKDAQNAEIAHAEWMEAHKGMQKFYQDEFD